MIVVYDFDACIVHKDIIIKLLTVYIKSQHRESGTKSNSFCIDILLKLNQFIGDIKLNT